MSLPSLNLKKWATGMLLPEMGSEDTPVLKICREKLLSFFFFLRNFTIGVAEESQSYVQKTNRTSHGKRNGQSPTTEGRGNMIKCD